MLKKKQITADELMKYNQTKVDCDKMLFALLGSEKLVNQWWQSANYAFNMSTPIDLFNSSEDGRQAVFNYLSEHCYGGY